MYYLTDFKNKKTAVTKTKAGIKRLTGVSNGSLMNLKTPRVIKGFLIEWVEEDEWS